MMKTLVVGAVVSFAQILLRSLAVAQSREEAIRLCKEADALYGKARSNDDLKQVLQKFEEALRIYSQVGNQKNTGRVHNSGGHIYADWGDYARAVEHREVPALRVLCGE